MPAAPMNRSVTLNRSVAIVLVLIAFTVIVGWQLNIPELKSLMSKDMVPMVANSAICLFCIGISLYLISLEESSRLRGYTRFFSAMAILLGTITLVEYIVDFNIGIDQYIYNQPSDISNHPGRMSILSALNFTLVGLCFFFEFRSPDWYKRFLIGQYAMFVVFFTTLYPFTGTIFGALHFSSHITTMAIPTATGFFLITIAYFIRHANHGWAALLFSKSIAGVLLRRIIIPVALVYPVIAFLSLVGEKEGLYNSEGGTVFMMVSSMALFTMIVLVTAETISRLDDEKDQYKKFFEISSEVLMIAGTDGSIKLVSHAFTKTLGYSNQEGVNNSFFYFVHPEDASTAIEHFEKMLTDVAIGTFQIQMKGKDGSTRHFLWSHTRDRKGGNVYAAGYDLTEIKEAQQIRELAKRLSHQNEQLASFAHIVSHNLRSHVGNLNSLLELHKDAELDEQGVMLGMMEKVTHHLSGTLGDLIESLRIKEDVNQERREIYFEQVLLKTQDILSTKIHESGASITHRFAVESIAYPVVYLESIFLNLISNAVKYRSPNRQLQIHIETIQIKGEVVLTVADNGLGINMAKHGDKLFGFYKTFHAVPDAKGLGLFITRTQVEAMGGVISVESEENKGAFFRVVLNKIDNKGEA